MHHQTCQNVCDGEEEQETSIRRIDDLTQHLACARDRREEIRVSEYNSLWDARRARCIDDGCDRRGA